MHSAGFFSELIGLMKKHRLYCIPLLKVIGDLVLSRGYGVRLEALELFEHVNYLHRPLTDWFVEAFHLQRQLLITDKVILPLVCILHGLCQNGIFPVSHLRELFGKVAWLCVVATK